MKSTELRIGNYVRIKDNNQIVRVEQITRRKIGFHYGTDRRRMSYRKYCEIEGIRIYDVQSRFTCPSLYWDDKADDENEYQYHDTFHPVKLHYLHELQNLHLALQGEELEVDL